LTLFNITSADVRRVLGCSRPSTIRWLKDLPFERKRRVGSYAGSPKFFALVDLVPAIRAGRRTGLSGNDLRAVCALAGPYDPTVAIGDDAGARGRTLRAVLTPEKMQRLDRMKTAFLKGLTEAFFMQTHFIPVRECLRHSASGRANLKIRSDRRQIAHPCEFQSVDRICGANNDCEQ
jgi:hypothetical protein